MGYKNFQVPKDIYLPILFEGDGIYTLEKYKESYGIDLKEYIYLDNDDMSIKLDFGFARLTVVSDSSFSVDTYKVIPVTIIEKTHYESGVADAVAIVGTYDSASEGNVGLKIYIPKDQDFAIENIRITKQEM